MDGQSLKTHDCYLDFNRTSAVSPGIYTPLLYLSDILNHTYGISCTVASRSSSRASLSPQRSSGTHFWYLESITPNSCFRYFGNPSTSRALSILEPAKPTEGWSAAVGLDLAQSALMVWHTGLYLVGVRVLRPLVAVVLGR